MPSHLRTWEQVLAYWPNQVYIGNKTPDDLAAVAEPWFDKTCEVNDRFGPFGQMMPQEEFILLMQACDVFDLVKLDKEFVAANKPALEANPLVDESICARIKAGIDKKDVEYVVDCCEEACGDMNQRGGNFAKACGITEPTVGILNVDGSEQAS